MTTAAIPDTSTNAIDAPSADPTNTSIFDVNRLFSEFQFDDPDADLEVPSLTSDDTADADLLGLLANEDGVTESEPVNADVQPVVKAPENKPTSQSKLEAAKADLRRRLEKKEEKSLEKRLADAEARANRQLSRDELEELARAELKKLDEEGLAPEQRMILEMQRKLEQFEAREAERVERERQAEIERSHAEADRQLMAVVEEEADRFPYLSSAGWSPSMIRQYVEKTIEDGVADDLDGALTYMDSVAGASANQFRTNRRALKAMLSDEAARNLVVEVLQEYGVVPAGRKAANVVAQALQQRGPTTLNHSLKEDGRIAVSPVLSDDPDVRRRQAIKLASGMLGIKD